MAESISVWRPEGEEWEGEEKRESAAVSQQIRRLSYDQLNLYAHDRIASRSLD